MVKHDAENCPANRSVVTWPVASILIIIMIGIMGYVSTSAASNDRVDGIDKRVEGVEGALLRMGDRLERKLDRFMETARAAK